MKHIPTFESFAAQLNEWKKPKVEDLVHNMRVKITRGRHAGATGTIHDFELTDKGDLVDDQIDILVDQPGKPFAYLGLADIMVESISLNEGEFWRLPKNAVGNDFYIAQKNLNLIYEAVKNGQDFDMKWFDQTLDILEKIKKQAKKFKSAEEVKGTVYEAIDPESGMMGLINTALGPRQGRLVVSGDNVEKHQEKILDAIRKVDKEARVEFFEKTGNIVGVIAITALKDIQKELRRIDGALTAEIKDRNLK